MAISSSTRQSSSINSSLSSSSSALYSSLLPISAATIQIYKKIILINCAQCNYIAMKEGKGLKWERVDVQVIGTPASYVYRFVVENTEKSFVFGQGVHLLTFNGEAVKRAISKEHDHFYRTKIVTICSLCAINTCIHSESGMRWNGVQQKKHSTPFSLEFIVDATKKRFLLGDGGVYTLKFNGKKVITNSITTHEHIVIKSSSFSNFSTHSSSLSSTCSSTSNSTALKLRDCCLITYCSQCKVADSILVGNWKGINIEVSEEGCKFTRSKTGKVEKIDIDGVFIAYFDGNEIEVIRKRDHKHIK